MYTRKEIIKEFLTPDVQDDPVKEAMKAQLEQHRCEEAYAHECAKMELARCNRMFAEGRWQDVLQLAMEEDFLEGRMRTYHVAKDHVALAALLVRKAVGAALKQQVIRDEENIEKSHKERRPATTVRTLKLMTPRLAASVQ